MRELKFRAWQKQKREMFEVGALQLREPRFVVKLNSLETWTLDEVELTQFTGLKDKNDKPIYDGDILRITNCWSEIEVAPVFWDVSRPLSGFDKAETWILRFKNGNVGPLYPYCETRNGLDVEVIGNIYENSELVRQA